MGYRVECKDEGHAGGRVDREDCLLVPRFSGGNYRRAGHMQDTLICVACASEYVARIKAGKYEGSMKVNRWSKSMLMHEYERMRRSQGLPEVHPAPVEPQGPGDALEALLNLDIAIAGLGWDPDNLKEEQS